MTICDYINRFKCCAGNYAAKVANDAIYGNETPESYFRMLSMSAMIRTLERQVTGTRTIKVKNSINGQLVDVSSLKSDGNVLYLDSVKTYKCLTTDIRPCLSEQEICAIIEKLSLMCAECNC